MKNFLKTTAFLCLSVLLLLSIFSCVYNPPEGYTEEHHTYEEIFAFAKSLDPNAVVSESYTDTKIDDWNRNFREWDAVINGIACHVSSVGATVWDATGEFAKQYYVIDTDYDYLVLQKIVSEKQPDWEMEASGFGSRYNRDGKLFVNTSYMGTEKLSDEELEDAWAKAYEIYQQYHSYPVRKEAYFSLSAPAIYVNNDGSKLVKITVDSMHDFSDDGKAAFFEIYAESWALLDSGLPVEQCLLKTSKGVRP